MCSASGHNPIEIRFNHGRDSRMHRGHDPTRFHPWSSQNPIGSRSEFSRILAVIRPDHNQNMVGFRRCQVAAGAHVKEVLRRAKELLCIFKRDRMAKNRWNRRLIAVTHDAHRAVASHIKFEYIYILPFFWFPLFLFSFIFF